MRDKQRESMRERQRENKERALRRKRAHVWLHGKKSFLPQYAIAASADKNSIVLKFFLKASFKIILFLQGAWERVILYFPRKSTIISVQYMSIVSPRKEL